MRSAEAAAADIFAQAMNTPSTEPLAKGRSEPEPKDEISFSGWEVFTFGPDLGKRGLRGSLTTG